MAYRVLPVANLALREGAGAYAWNSATLRSVAQLIKAQEGTVSVFEATTGGLINVPDAPSAQCVCFLTFCPSSKAALQSVPGASSYYRGGAK